MPAWDAPITPLEQAHHLEGCDCILRLENVNSEPERCQQMPGMQGSCVCTLVAGLQFVQQKIQDA